MKYILLTDIHFGAKGNSDEFNEQCIEFLKWVKKETYNLSKLNNFEIGCTIFLGDWFHNRNSINVKTLNYGIKGLQILSEIGNRHVKFLLGNHDLYYRDRRDIFSIPSIKTEDSYIHIIDKPFVDSYKNLFCPWLIEEEKLSDLIKQYNPQYVFGHFEIPSFSFNRLSKYDGEYNPSDYQGPKRILSGHFHMRQEKNNITYIGNCFSHDFSDVDDWHNKGFALLDTDTNEVTYYEWKDAPKYTSIKISKLQNLNIENNMHIKLINDMNLKQVELNQVKEKLESLKNVKQCLIYSSEIIDDIILAGKDEKNNKCYNIGNISDYIVELISSMNGEEIDNNKLINIYRELAQYD